MSSSSSFLLTLSDGLAQVQAQLPSHNGGDAGTCKDLIQTLRNKVEEETQKQRAAGGGGVEVAHTMVQTLRERVVELEGKLAAAMSTNTQVHVPPTDNVMLDETVRKLARREHELADLQRIAQDERNAAARDKGQMETEIINLQASVSEKTALTHTLRAQLDTASDTQSHLELSLKRLQQQLEMAEKHAEWQKNEMEAMSKQLATTRAEQSRQISTLENDRIQLKAQVDDYKNKNQHLIQQMQTSSAEKLELTRHMEDLKSTLEQSNIARENESASHRRLVDHLKASETSLEMEKKSALDALSQCQRSMAAAAAQAETALAEKETRIKQLEQDLVKAKAPIVLSQEQQDKLKALPSLAPSLLEEGLGQQGLTRSELYSRYAKEVELRTVAETQCNQLQLHLNRIYKEVDDKVPFILKLRTERDRMMESHDKTMTRLIESQNQLQQQQQLVVVLQRDLENAHAAEEAAKRDATDLAMQVRHLLSGPSTSSPTSTTTTTSATRTPPRDLSQTHNLDSSFAQDVISENLVTFSNVNELLERNHQLLRVVRRLSEEREKDNTVEKDTQACWEEIENLRIARSRQEEMIAAIIVQRDMYRTLLAQADGQQPALFLVQNL